MRFILILFLYGSQGMIPSDKTLAATNVVFSDEAACKAALSRFVAMRDEYEIKGVCVAEASAVPTVKADNVCEHGSVAGVCTMPMRGGN